MPGNVTKLPVGGRFKADQLRKLSDLLKRGIMTRTEFERRRAELFGRSGNEDKCERADTLIMEALAMLTESEAISNPSATNVVSFESRKSARV